MNMTASAVVPEGATAKPETLWLATNASFPGYWGSHKDGPHHAIAECIAAGADRGSVFVVHEGYAGCYISDMGGMTFLKDHGEPRVEGVYDATGQWLGDTLMEVAKDCRESNWWVLEHPVLSKATVANLKAHKG